MYGTAIATVGEGGSTANGFTMGTGARLGWAGGGFNVAGAQFTTRNTASAPSFKDQVLGVSYDFGIARLGVAQRRWVFGADKTVNTQVGAVIPAGAGIVKLTSVQADQTGATAAQSANDAKLFGAGYVHALSKRTAVYAHVARLDNEAAAAFAIPGGPAVSGASTAANFFGGQKSTAFEMGLRHDFQARPGAVAVERGVGRSGSDAASGRRGSSVRSATTGVSRPPNDDDKSGTRSAGCCRTASAQGACRRRHECRGPCRAVGPPP